MNEINLSKLDLSKYEQYVNKSLEAGAKDLKGMAYLKQVVSNMSHNMKAFINQVHTYFNERTSKTHERKWMSNEKIIKNLNNKLERLEKQLEMDFEGLEKKYSPLLMDKAVDKMVKDTRSILDSMDKAGIAADDINKLGKQLEILEKAIHQEEEKLKEQEKVLQEVPNRKEQKSIDTEAEKTKEHESQKEAKRMADARLQLIKGREKELHAEEKKRPTETELEKPEEHEFKVVTKRSSQKLVKEELKGEPKKLHKGSKTIDKPEARSAPKKFISGKSYEAEDNFDLETAKQKRQEVQKAKKEKIGQGELAKKDKELKEASEKRRVEGLQIIPIPGQGVVDLSQEERLSKFGEKKEAHEKRVAEQSDPGMENNKDLEKLKEKKQEKAELKDKILNEQIHSRSAAKEAYQLKKAANTPFPELSQLEENEWGEVKKSKTVDTSEARSAVIEPGGEVLQNSFKEKISLLDTLLTTLVEKYEELDVKLPFNLTDFELTENNYLDKKNEILNKIKVTLNQDDMLDRPDLFEIQQNSNIKNIKKNIEQLTQELVSIKKGSPKITEEKEVLRKAPQGIVEENKKASEGNPLKKTIEAKASIDEKAKKQMGHVSISRNEKISQKYQDRKNLEKNLDELQKSFNTYLEDLESNGETSLGGEKIGRIKVRLNLIAGHNDIKIRKAQIKKYLDKLTNKPSGFIGSLINAYTNVDHINAPKSFDKFQEAYNKTFGENAKKQMGHVSISRDEKISQKNQDRKNLEMNLDELQKSFNAYLEELESNGETSIGREEIVYIKAKLNDIAAEHKDVNFRKVHLKKYLDKLTNKSSGFIGGIINAYTNVDYKAPKTFDKFQEAYNKTFL